MPGDARLLEQSLLAQGALAVNLHRRGRLRDARRALELIYRATAASQDSTVTQTRFPVS